MDELTGRVDDDGERFFADTNDAKEVKLFVTPMQAAEEPEPFDLTPLAGRRVRVICQTWGGSDTAWGVESVTPLD